METASACQKAVAAVDELAQDLIALTQALVRIPTETHPPYGDEGPGQAYLAHYLAERFGWEIDQFLPTAVDGIESHPGWWPGLIYTDRPNVVATLCGAGGGRSLILNGHMDVVPTGPREQWTYDPYAATIDDGKIYGRGAADMKGGIAAMIYAAYAVTYAGIKLKGDVIIESVVNEELGGYNGTLACCLRGYQADAALVTEGTRCQIMPAHKGGQVLRLQVSGRSAHSNLWWQGVSALDKAIMLKRVLAEFERERTAETSNNPYFGDRNRFPVPALVDTVWSLAAGTPEVMATPATAVLDFWCDALPGEELDTIVDRLAVRIQAAADCDPFLCEQRPTLDRRTIMRPFYPTAVPRHHPIVNALADSCHLITGETPPIFGAPFACDAMMFNLYSSTPAVIFGPGDVGVAHSPDEYIEIDELVRAAKIMACTLVNWCGIAA